MAQTVIGFFDNAAEAQRAVEQLQSRGISRDHIDVSRGSGQTGTTGHTGSGITNPKDPNTVAVTDEGRTVDREGRNTNKITDFFNSLFGGSDNDDAGRYSHVGQRAGAIVTVHAQSREEAEQAADILDDAGAVDVDERASQSGYTHTRSTEGLGDRQNISGRRDTDLSGNAGNSLSRRSRIIDRSVDDQWRLRDSDV
jgi:hypothetical protein